MATTGPTPKPMWKYECFRCGHKHDDYGGCPLCNKGDTPMIDRNALALDDWKQLLAKAERAGARPSTIRALKDEIEALQPDIAALRQPPSDASPRAREALQPFAYVALDAIGSVPARNQEVLLSINGAPIATLKVSEFWDAHAAWNVQPAPAAAPTLGREALDALLAFRHGDTKHLTRDHARDIYAALSAPDKGGPDESRDALAQECREILDWHATGTLVDGMVRKRASAIEEKLGLMEHQALAVAEKEIADAAMNAALAISVPGPEREALAHALLFKSSEGEDDRPGSAYNPLTTTQRLELAAALRARSVAETGK